MSMLRAHQGKWETLTLEEFEQRENEILQELEGQACLLSRLLRNTPVTKGKLFPFVIHNVC